MRWLCVFLLASFFSATGCSLVAPASRRTVDFDAGGASDDARADARDGSVSDVRPDVPGRDVPDFDAPGPDAPERDAPERDAPELDTPPPADAGTDAPVIDAPMDDAPDTPCATESGYRDLDGDGFGAGMLISQCVGASVLVATNTDCDDADRMVSPGVVDTQCDGVDSDCDTVAEGVDLILSTG